MQERVNNTTIHEPENEWNLITVVVLLLAAGGLAGYYLPVCCIRSRSLC